MQEQLNRIEVKLDRILDSQSAHNGRLVRLETHSGFIKVTVAFLISVALTIGGWALNKH